MLAGRVRAALGRLADGGLGQLRPVPAGVCRRVTGSGRVGRQELERLAGPERVVSTVRVVLVIKKPLLERSRTGARRAAVARVSTAWPVALQRARKALEEHREAVARVERVLDHFGAEVQRVEGPPPPGVRWNDVDLVVAVGGDGTLLAASHAVDATPIVGVNSSPSSSVGHFCAVGPERFAAAFEAIAAGRASVVELTRLRIEVEDERVPVWGLNEVLLAHANPAGTARFVLAVGGERAELRSGGLWVATAAGSTGAIASAGGRPVSWSDKRLQFVVREPFRPDARARGLLQGFAPAGLEALSLTCEGRLFIDGTRHQWAWPCGAVARITPDAPPLRLVWPDPGGA